jgi:uncharacterized protein
VTPPAGDPSRDPAVTEPPGAAEPDGAAEPQGATEPDTGPVAVLRVMEVVHVHVPLPSQFPVVTLREAEAPFRSMELPIGMAEGVALAHALHKVATPRPLTHELFVSVLERLHVDIVAVRLVGRAGGTYLAELDLMGTSGREVVPARPSDGLVLALRAAVAVPVLADDRLIEGQGDVEPRVSPPGLRP